MNRERRPFFSTPFFAILGRSAGMFIPFLIALFFGAVPATDAFFLAYGVIFFLGELFTQMFEALLIPFLTEMHGDKNRIFRFVTGVLVASLVPMVVILALLWFGLVPALIHLVGVSLAQARQVMRIFIELTPLFFLGTVNAAGNSVFYSQKKFWFPAFSPFLRSIVVIVFFPLAYRWLGIHALTVGFVAGEIVRTVVTFRFLRRSGFWTLDGFGLAGSEGMAKFFGHAPFQLLALIGIHLAPLVNQWFAMALGEGKLSLLTYAERLLQVPYQIFLIGFLQIFFSYWSDSYYHESSVFFWSKIRRDVRTVIICAAVFSALLWAVRYPLVRICFGHGEISSAQLPVMAQLFGWLAAGFVPGVMFLLYFRVLFVMKRSRFYFILSWCKLALHVILNLFFVRICGLVGIAVATTVVYTATAAVLHFYLATHSKKEMETL